MITELAGLNIISFLLTLSSYYFPVERMVVFAPSVIATYVFTMLAEYILLIHPPQFGRIIRTCIHIAEDRKLAWTKDLVGPYFTERILPELVVYTCLIFALTGMWLFLWLRRGWWVPTLEEARLPTADRSEFETRTAPFQPFKHSKPEWVVGVCVMLMSMTLAGVAAYLLDGIMRGRRGMILNSDGETGENLWGVGQIAALFVWAPLLVEMGYNAAYGCKTYFAARSPPFIPRRS
jgi:hypothetical protein